MNLYLTATVKREIKVWAGHFRLKEVEDNEIYKQEEFDCSQTLLLQFTEDKDRSYCWVPPA